MACLCHTTGPFSILLLSSLKKKKIFFLMQTIFKVFVEFVKILLLFNVLASFGLLWALGSPTRDLTHNFSIGRRSLNH